LTDAAWKAVDDEATARLKTNLAARKLVDFSGPHGWAHSATALGRSVPIASPSTGARARLRRVLPLVELRMPFTLARAELDDVARGADDIDLSGLEQAAHAIAVTENAIVFHGYPEAGIDGIVGASPHPVLPLPEQGAAYPRAVAKSVALLQDAGVGGPYGLAVAPAVHTSIVEAVEYGGYLLLDHLRGILGGPVVRAPGVEGAVVLSLRGGDFVLEAGQDLSVGYAAHSVDTVGLYLEESLTFRVTAPDAAVALAAPAT
jgi:uncharacterized linocin/CFP29 family protein